MASEVKMVIRVITARTHATLYWRAHGKTGTLYFPGYGNQVSNLALFDHSSNKAFWTAALNTVSGNLY